MDDLAADDWHRTNPRFQGENFKKNLELVDAVQEMARANGCTPSQLALAWLLARDERIVPIPGTRRSERLKENAAAVEIELTGDDLEWLDTIAPTGSAAGSRYPEGGMRTVNR